MSLAKRTVTSTAWNFAANSIRLIAALIRTVLLARWLPVSVFGVYGYAAAVVNLSAVVVNFGMGPAFLHRAPETEDEDRAAAVHFTLKLIFTLVWAALLTGYACAFTEGPTRTALLVLTVTTGGVQLAETGRLVLARRVVHRRLALLDLLSVLLATLLALALAWRGLALWALLAVDVAIAVLSPLGLYLWQPAWRPHLAWSPPVVRYFLRFGSRTFVANLISTALDRIDDLWTASNLGETALGFYSRAYAFAHYPRNILAVPINAVASGTYSELKGDRLRLSRAFFRINALLVRSSFFLAGLLALVAPEFVRLALGRKWLPMLDAFRLMLLYTLLDPIQKTVGKVFAAVGRPEQVARVRCVQLIVLVSGLFLLGPRLRVAGVALAAVAMLVVGMVILLYEVQAQVDISLWQLFAAPCMALTLAMVLARGAIMLPGILGSDWRTGLVKALCFSVTFVTVLVFLEHDRFLRALQFVAGQVSDHTGPVAKGEEHYPPSG